MGTPQSIAYGRRRTLYLYPSWSMGTQVHGVSDVIEETSEFVAAKILQMRQVLDNMSVVRRQAWDRAVFLRPALSEDQQLYLMCLRARHFCDDDAASLLVAYFQAKLDLFGDDLSIHRITWDDVSGGGCPVSKLAQTINSSSPICPIADRARTQYFSVRCISLLAEE